MMRCTNSATESTAIFSITLARCASTVFKLMSSSAAITLFA